MAGSWGAQLEQLHLAVEQLHLAVEKVHLGVEVGHICRYSMPRLLKIVGEYLGSGVGGDNT